jgi:hypothetical protein
MNRRARVCNPVDIPVCHQEAPLGIAHRRLRLFRSVMIAGFTVASQMALGLGSASASEAVPEPEVFSGATVDPAPAMLRTDDIEFGLGALALMKRERSEQRRVPKMLPLVAARTAHGQLWLGLARGRSPAQPSGDVRLELWWTVPIGR